MHALFRFLPAALLLMTTACATPPGPAAPPTLRVATYNTSLYDDADGGLVRRLEAGDEGARKIAAVLQQVRPDLVLLNEFDYDPEGRAADLFQRQYLEQPQAGGGEPLRYPYRYLAEVNTGVPSGLDLDNNGEVGGEGRARGNDAWGYGLHPGQYGMLVLSMHPIDAAQVRSFRLLRWADMPGARRPVDPATGQPWHKDEVWRQLRLSSKSHWDLPVRTPLGTVHFLVSHPTPPVFDGRRTATARATPTRSGCGRNTSRRANTVAVRRRRPLRRPRPGRALRHRRRPQQRSGRWRRPQRSHPRPARTSAGAAHAHADLDRWCGKGQRIRCSGAAASRRAGARDRRFRPRSGAMRLDYVLPSTGFALRGSGVFWPASDDPAAAIADGSDHHLVWVELAAD
jgi:hypothetical protein